VQFIFQQFLSFAWHVAKTSPVEQLTLLSWKRATYNLMKATCAGAWRVMCNPVIRDEKRVACKLTDATCIRCIVMSCMEPSRQEAKCTAVIAQNFSGQAVR
jgi:hypothetical protein